MGFWKEGSSSHSLPPNTMGKKRNGMGSAALPLSAMDSPPPSLPSRRLTRRAASVVEEAPHALEGAQVVAEVLEATEEEEVRGEEAREGEEGDEGEEGESGDVREEEQEEEEEEGEEEDNQEGKGEEDQEEDNEEEDNKEEREDDEERREADNAPPIQVSIFRVVNLCFWVAA